MLSVSVYFYAKKFGRLVTEKVHENSKVGRGSTLVKNRYQGESLLHQCRETSLEGRTNTVLLVMETKVRVVAREIINGLKNADNTQSLITWLNAAKCLTAAADEKETKLPSALQHFSDVPLHQLQTLFRERHFGAVCSTILDLLSVEWVQKLPGNCFAEHVHVLFLTGPAADALLALDHAVQTHR